MTSTPKRGPETTPCGSGLMRGALGAYINGVTAISLFAFRSVRAASWALASCLVASGCGGEGSKQHAKSPDDVAEANGDDESGIDDGEDVSGTEAPPVADADPCEDGSCTPCGDGLCPEGFYCDESAASGPGCGWLPQCAKSPSCGCFEKALGDGCSCSERDGGYAVTCG